MNQDTINNNLTPILKISKITKSNFIPVIVSNINHVIKDADINIDIDKLKYYENKEEDIEKEKDILHEILTTDTRKNHEQTLHKKMLHMKENRPLLYLFITTLLKIILTAIASQCIIHLIEGKNIKQINNTVIINNYGDINKDKKKL